MFDIVPFGWLFVVQIHSFNVISTVSIVTETMMKVGEWNIENSWQKVHWRNVSWLVRVVLMIVYGSSVARVFYHKSFDSTSNITSVLFCAFYSVTDWQEGSCLCWQYHPTTCSITSFWSENHFPRCHYFHEFLFPFILSLTLSLDILIQRRWRREKNEMLKTDVKQYSKTNVLRLVRVGNSSIESRVVEVVWCSRLFQCSTIRHWLYL